MIAKSVEVGWALAQHGFNKCEYWVKAQPTKIKALRREVICLVLPFQFD